MHHIWSNVAKCVVCGVVVGATVLVSGCGSNKLSSEDKKTWQRFLDKHLASGMVQPTGQDATDVAAIGDAIVPYIEENLGEAYRRPGAKADYWLVVVLGRIGTPRAVEVIIKVLKHEYPGKLGTDRQVAAKALVWLGISEAAPILKEVIADHQRRIDEKGSVSLVKGIMYKEEINDLKHCLKQLEQGKGKRDMKNFPFDLM